MSNEHTPAQRLVQRMFNCTKPDCEICQARVRMIEAEYSAKQRIVEAAKAYVETEAAVEVATKNLRKSEYENTGECYDALMAARDEFVEAREALRAAVQGASE